MSLYKTREFASWAKGEGLSNASLQDAFEDLKNGGGDSLGGHVHKVRVALGNRGKRGGARTLIAYKKDNQGFFVHGFAKNQRANITKKEKNAFKKLAKEYLGLTDKGIVKVIKTKELSEVK